MTAEVLESQMINFKEIISVRITVKVDTRMVKTHKFE